MKLNVKAKPTVKRKVNKNNPSKSINLNIGDFEKSVFFSVLEYEKTSNAYGVAIQKSLATRLNRPYLLIGNIYNSLERLEKKGFITSYLGESSPTRGGKPKRLYKTTSVGRKAVYDIVKHFDEIRDRVVLCPS